MRRKQHWRTPWVAAPGTFKTDYQDQMWLQTWEIDIQTASVSSLWGLFSSSMETQTVCGYFCSWGATQNHFLDSGCVEYLLHRLEITIREKKKNPRNPPQPVLVDTVTVSCGSSGIIFHFSNKPQIKRASSRKDDSKKIWNALSKITENSGVVM